MAETQLLRWKLCEGTISGCNRFLFVDAPVMCNLFMDMSTALSAACHDKLTTVLCLFSVNDNFKQHVSRDV